MMVVAQATAKNNLVFSCVGNHHDQLWHVQVTCQAWLFAGQAYASSVNGIVSWQDAI